MAGLILEPELGHAASGYMQHQCFPLTGLLLALDNPKVNYFSLDIEGAEFQVLKSIAWEKVDIEVLSVELTMPGLVFPGSRDQVHEYLEEKNFVYIGTLGDSDDLFVRRDKWEAEYFWDR